MANWSKAVTKITAGGEGRASITAKPSSSGICTSRKTRSGARSRMACRAGRPSWHSPAISMPGSAASSVRRRSHASGSSSTISTRMQWLRVGGNVEAGAGSAAGRICEIETRGGAVELLETRAGIGDPDAFADLGGAGTVVADFDGQLAGALLGDHVDAAAGGARRDAVADGVFDQRLQYEVGHEQVERAGLDGAAHFEPLAEAHLLDFEVFIEVLHLAFQRDLLNAGTIEGEPQKIAEPRDHAVGALHITIHERGDGVQRVEEKMRLKLHLENLDRKSTRLNSSHIPLSRM